MSAPLVETWRVADHAPTAPAHLVVFQREQVTAMACGWMPSRPGELMGRQEMLARCRFACIRCVRTAAKSGRRRPTSPVVLVDEVET